MSDDGDDPPVSGRLDRTMMETTAQRSETHPLADSLGGKPPSSRSNAGSEATE